MVKQTKIKRKNLYLLCTKPLGSILVKRFTFRYVIFQSCWYNKNICQNKDICYKKNIATIRIVAQLRYLLQKRDCYNKDITTIKIFATIREYIGHRKFTFKHVIFQQAMNCVATIKIFATKWILLQ